MSAEAPATRPLAPNTCRSCHAPIFWATTFANERPIPLDFEPRSDGNVILDRRPGIGLVAITNGPLELLLLDPDVERYMPHHATCPDADEWRGRQ